MNTNEAIRAMLDSAGLTPYAASLAMGRAHSYVAVVLKRGGLVGAPTLSELGKVCGYTLALVPHGSTLPSGSIVLDGKDG